MYVTKGVQGTANLEGILEASLAQIILITFLLCTREHNTPYVPYLTYILCIFHIMYVCNTHIYFNRRLRVIKCLSCGKI